MTETSINTASSRGMQLEEVLALDVAVDLDTANRALRIGRTKGFDLAKRGEYPVPVSRDGRTYRVNRADLLRELGIDPNGSGAGSSHPAPPVGSAPLATTSSHQ